MANLILQIITIGFISETVDFVPESLLARTAALCKLGRRRWLCRRCGPCTPDTRHGDTMHPMILLCRLLRCMLGRVAAGPNYHRQAKHVSDNCSAHFSLASCVHFSVVWGRLCGKAPATHTKQTPIGGLPSQTGPAVNQRQT